MGVAESTLYGSAGAEETEKYGLGALTKDSVKEHKSKQAVPALPSHFVDRSAFESAAKVIDEKMERQGLISANDALKTLVHFQTLSETVIKHFKGAQDGKFIVEDLMRKLNTIGVTVENTIFAQSICPDEINHRATDINKLIGDIFGKVFHLGGLAGIPFTGKTGFLAFSHHVPDGGNLIVFMAPHIGVNNEYSLGQFEREGRCDGNSACGAAIGALNICCSKPAHKLPDLYSPQNSSDYQMTYIISQVCQRIDVIKAKEDPNERQAELAVQCYDIAKNLLDEIVSTEFGTGKLVIITGIQINMPRPMNDYFQPKEFYVLQRGKEKIDLFDETFGGFCRESIING
jgi:hypothetical protein